MNNNRQRENSNSEPGLIPLLDESDSDLLFCQQERLDQNSPELWPETMPGVNEFTSSALFSSPPKPVLSTVSSLCLYYLYYYCRFNPYTLLGFFPKSLRQCSYIIKLELVLTLRSAI